MNPATGLSIISANNVSYVSDSFLRPYFTNYKLCFEIKKKPWCSFPDCLIIGLVCKMLNIDINNYMSYILAHQMLQILIKMNSF